jgi:hypothetical protein
MRGRWEKNRHFISSEAHLPRTRTPRLFDNSEYAPIWASLVGKTRCRNRLLVVFSRQRHPI